MHCAGTATPRGENVSQRAELTLKLGPVHGNLVVACNENIRGLFQAGYNRYSKTLSQSNFRWFMVIY